MEHSSRNKSLNTILILIGVGIWVIVLQNVGVIPKLAITKTSVQTVYVQGGHINADVKGFVGISGSVDVTGSVDADNLVDVNLHVLGRPVGSHRSYVINGREYQAIDVFQSNKW